MIRDVRADTILTYDDVTIDERLAATRLRRECEAMVSGEQLIMAGVAQ